MRTISALFKALSDQTRLEILALLLRHGELCVCDIEAVLQVTQSKASRHLRYLLNAGIVCDRRDGLWVRYRITNRPSGEAQVLLEALPRLLTAAAAGVELRYQRWLVRKPAEAASAPAMCCAPGSGAEF